MAHKGTMSNTKRITLYGAVDSPFPHRVRLALEEAGAEYDTIVIDLLNKPEWYGQKVYPDAKVPYLVYGGPQLKPDEAPSPDLFQIPESTVILELLADILPDARLLPTDPALRAKARLFYQTVDAKFVPAFFGFIFLGAKPEELHNVLERLQRMLPPTGFAVGEWSIADAALMPFLVPLEGLLRMPPPTVAEGDAEEAREIMHSPRFARLQRYIEDNVARPSMAKTWNEEAVRQKFAQRIERLQRTGIVNSEIRLPTPARNPIRL